MKKLVLALGLFCAPLGAAAEVGSAVLRDVVDHHILPRYTTLAERTDALAAVAQQNCAPDDAALRNAYHDAFDAWIAVSHLRFGLCAGLLARQPWGYTQNARGADHGCRARGP